MKKLILSITIMIAGLSQAQVVISNQANATPTNSSVLLEFGNNENKGIILPSVSEVLNPVAGTFAVNTTAKAVQYFDGTAWIDLTYPDVLVENPFVNDSIADAGEGVVIGAESSSKPGVLVLESTTQAMVLPHVTDPHLNVLSPVAGTIVYDTTSDALAVYDGTEWSYWAANELPPPSHARGVGTLSGRACFDVVEINDGGDCGTLASRMAQKADFSQTATNTQTYTFTPTGTVSNVRFVYVNTNGQVIQSITPDADYSGTLTNPQTATATVVYYNNLNTTAAGLSREDALIGDIYVIYNNSANNTGTDLQLKLTAKVQDCNCCGAMTFANPDGTGGVVWREFMCHNMGATMSADPFIPAAAIHGAKYQWGAMTGNNTVYISQTQDQASPNNPPGYTSTIAPNGSWTDNKGPNDPCPAGYRVPSRLEWEGVVANNTITRIGSFFESNTNYAAGAMVGNHLFLPAGGARYNLLRYRGAWGYYWSSTQGDSTHAHSLLFNGTTFLQVVGNEGNSRRDLGHSVRCIAE